MLKGFREFLLRGNVIDLAVAVVIGAAFGAVVAAFSTDFIGGVLGRSAARPTSAMRATEIRDLLAAEQRA
jgi:large conductance mechanosensitive channel